MFCRTEIRSVVHMHSSADAERIWCLLHGDLGPVRIGVWYRAPDAAPTEISTLIDELSDTSPGVTGTILLGDMNIVHLGCDFRRVVLLRVRLCAISVMTQVFSRRSVSQRGTSISWIRFLRT